jgi:CubicO group peptidase (beta-lactamase class C family)
MARVGLLLALCVACGRNDEAAPARVPELSAHRARIAALLREHHVPGVAIARVRDGSIETATFGDARAGVPVTADTVFQAASLTKPLLARTAMLAGLALDKPLEGATPRELLQHVAGGKWQYSGDGYVRVQRALEESAGEPFDRIAQRLVFDPLHLERTTLVTPRHVATGHDRSGKPTEVQDWPKPVAAASLHTTAGEYARFVRSLFGEPLRKMLARTVDIGEADLRWGLGWAVEDWHGERWFFHWGANPGYRSFVLGNNARREALVILTNGENGLELAEDLVELVRDERHPLFEFRMLHPTD